MYVKDNTLNIILAIISLLLFLIFLNSPNFLISAPVLLYVPFIYKFFYIKGNVNVIFWGLLYQWTSVSIHLLYCNIIGIDLNTYFTNTPFPGDLMEYTVFLSTIGLYSFSLGIYAAIRFLNTEVYVRVWSNYNPLKVLQVYVVLSVLISISQAIIWNFPNVVQYFYFLFYIKWGFFLATFLIIFKYAPNLKIYLYCLIGVEFALGLSSFFASNFINILLFSIIAFTSVSKRISFFHGVLLAFMGFLLFNIAVLWTASKNDYRSFLNEGKVSQTVTVSNEAAREKLFELVSSIDNATYRRAVSNLVDRVGYVQFFAASMRYVPAKVPHENGKIYWAAISHFLIPRFINPNKPILDDSKHTNQYTGLKVSGIKSATSFSLGSFADAYIDFGDLFMFVPLFLFGYLFGFFYKYLYQKSINNFWGLILTAPFFLLVNIYATDTAKALGFILIYFVTVAVLSKFIMKFFDPLMQIKQTSINQ